MQAPEAGPGPSVRMVEVGPDDEGQRIDNFLMRHLKGVPKSRIYRLLRRGEVRVNKRRAKPEYKLLAGDVVRIPPVRMAEQQAQAPIPSSVLEQLAAAVVLEDEDLMVLNKPAGLPVHGGSGVRFGVIEALRQLWPNQPFLELAHRLDRDTSGCLVIAKSRAALRQLHDLLRAGGVEKHYLTLVVGRWKGGQRRVSEALARTGRRGVERLVEVSESGREAESLFAPVTRFAEATLMDVSISTGRTHQIRVHAAHLGYPVAGDKKYGDFDFNRRIKGLGLKRLFLHAASLRFRLPESGRKYAVEVPLDDELRRVIAKLETL